MDPVEVALLAGGERHDREPVLERLLVLLECVEEAGGRIIKDLGDGFFITFTDAQEAVLAALRIQALDIASLQTEPMSPKQQVVVDQGLADAHELLNHREQVLAACRRLLKANPVDVSLLRRLADLESRSPTAADWKLARERWSKLEALEKLGSKEWLNARVGVIQTSLQLGERAEAEKLLRATRSLYPELGDAETRARFKALEGDLRAAPKK